MGGFADYSRHDALGLAELVRRGEVRPLELVEEAIARIERVNPRLNAVVNRLDDLARAAAAAPPAGPFAGVPFLLKDLLAAVEGQPLSSGSRLQHGWIAPRDSELVSRYRRAGLLFVGQTNTPELGLVPVTEPALWGPARNPWDLERTPGGSSGGSAAAVAAGIVPMANGGDGGGSIRIPAACCGLFGLKPTRARTPAGPVDVEHWQGCAIQHAITRTVRDSAALLDATHGPDVGAPYHAPPPARPFLDEVGAPPGRLRIAFTTRPPVPAEVDPECVAAVADAARLCADLGHEVVEAAPEIDPEAFARHFVRMLVAETAADVRDGEHLVGRRARWGDLEPPTALLALLGQRISAAEYAEGLRELKRISRRVGRFFAAHDVLLTPTLARPPIPVGSLLPSGAERAVMQTLVRLGAGRTLRLLGVLDHLARHAWSFAAFTAPFNVTGQPAMNVPLVWSAGGLPVGTQFVGRFGEEATLFRLAAQLEEARPWRDRRPPVHADAPAA